VRERNIHLIHSQTPRTNLLGSVVSKFTGVPVVWHARNLLDKGMIDIDRLFLGLTGRLICNSNIIKSRFIKKGKSPSKIIAIYNGVDLGKFNVNIKGDEIRRQFNIDKGTPLIGIAGRLDPRKGQRYFIQAAKEVINIFPEVKFLIVGEAFFSKNRRYKAELKNLTKSLNLSETVIFTGFREDIPQVLSALDILVMASDAEPFGRVMIEAMAMAKPVVAADSGASPEIVLNGETGILVSPKDSKALAKGIIKLVGDKEKAIELGRAGRKRVEKFFSIGKNVSETEEVYLDLLKKRNGKP